MNENSSREPNHNPASQPPRTLSWEDLPGCVVVIHPGEAVKAHVFSNGREQFELILFREGMRGLFDVFVRSEKISDQAVVAMGRAIIDHLATEPEWKEVL